MNANNLPRPSLAARLAVFFNDNPNQWIDGRRLAAIAGAYAWRTRVSDLRRVPFNMHVENRQRQIEMYGELVTVSEYRFVVLQDVKSEEGATASAPTLTAAV